MRHQPVINLLGISEEEVEVSTEFLEFWKLQFNQTTDADVQIRYTHDAMKIGGLENDFSHSYNLNEILNQISPLNLSYVEQLFDIKEEQIEMIRLVRKELAENLEELINVMTQNDAKQIKHFAHKMTTKLLVLSIPAITNCRYLEENAHDLQSDAMQKNYQLLKMYCLIRLWQIQDI